MITMEYKLFRMFAALIIGVCAIPYIPAIAMSLILVKIVPWFVDEADLLSYSSLATLIIGLFYYPFIIIPVTLYLIVVLYFDLAEPIKPKIVKFGVRQLFKRRKVVRLTMKRTGDFNLLETNWKCCSQMLPGKKYENRMKRWQ